MMWVWFGLTIACLVIECSTAELVAVWFAAASLVLGLIVAIFPSLGIIWQLGIFAVISAILLVATRPIVKKLLIKKKGAETNLELILNHTAIVVEEIDNVHEKGAVKINGIIWSARSEDGAGIESGSMVTVKQIQGNKLIVEKK